MKNNKLRHRVRIIRTLSGSWALMAILFTGCEQKPQRYTQNSTEIDTYKKVIDAYEKQDWASMLTHYADTAKIQNNATEKKAQTVSQMVSQNKEDARLFSSWDFVDTASEYEMVITDKGETWVNFWGLWQGTLKATGQVYEIPTHSTIQFANGKIVKEHGYWDMSALVLDLAKLQETTEVETAAE
ncbi:ester cyclase [Arenibacter sp. GZD96]|uniref:nuclear transport factor 2 family protein n=1 Tax=Aurantibrevibacter litoralis TaxID=3106030 RepID=UPI002AFF958E|nr:ester cyclase [Arenibacter sp. GZD-96]MEA1786140.1 ester cyclase [Arenibacter sp. GZD-96]